MNDLVYHAQFWLTEGNLSLFDTSLKLNEMPFSFLDYTDPRQTLRSLEVEQPTTDRGHA